MTMDAGYENLSTGMYSTPLTYGTQPFVGNYTTPGNQLRYDTYERSNKRKDTKKLLHIGLLTAAITGIVIGIKALLTKGKNISVKPNTSYEGSAFENISNFFNDTSRKIKTKIIDIKGKFKSKSAVSNAEKKEHPGLLDRIRIKKALKNAEREEKAAFDRNVAAAQEKYNKLYNDKLSNKSARESAKVFKQAEKDAKKAEKAVLKAERKERPSLWSRIWNKGKKTPAEESITEEIITDSPLGVNKSTNIIDEFDDIFTKIPEEPIIEDLSELGVIVKKDINTVSKSENAPKLINIRQALANHKKSHKLAKKILKNSKNPEKVHNIIENMTTRSKKS